MHVGTSGQDIKNIVGAYIIYKVSYNKYIWAQVGRVSKYKHVQCKIT